MRDILEAILAGDATEGDVAAYDVHRHRHHGKVGVLCLAPEEGLGVRDPATRARHEGAIHRFRNA